MTDRAHQSWCRADLDHDYDCTTATELTTLRADNDVLTKRYIRVAGQRDAARARVAELEVKGRALLAALPHPWTVLEAAMVLADATASVSENKGEKHGVADSSRGDEVGEGDPRVAPHRDDHDREAVGGEGDPVVDGRATLAGVVSEGEGRLPMGGTTDSPDHGQGVVTVPRASDASKPDDLLKQAVELLCEFKILTEVEEDANVVGSGLYVAIKRADLIVDEWNQRALRCPNEAKAGSPERFERAKQAWKDVTGEDVSHLQCPDSAPTGLRIEGSFRESQYAWDIVDAQDRTLATCWTRASADSLLASLSPRPDSAEKKARTRCTGCGHFDNELTYDLGPCSVYGTDGHHMVDVDARGVQLHPKRTEPTEAQLLGGMASSFDEEARAIVEDVDEWLAVNGPVTRTHLASVSARLKRALRLRAETAEDKREREAYLGELGVLREIANRAWEVLYEIDGIGSAPSKALLERFGRGLEAAFEKRQKIKAAKQRGGEAGKPNG